MRYLVLGCGNVGMELARGWTADGHAVVGTTTSPDRLAQLREVCAEVAVLRGDDAGAVAAAADGVDAVVVTVSPRLSRAVDPQRRAEEYALALTATARSAAAAHDRVVFASSTSVYGRAEGVATLDETARTTASTDPSPVNFLAAEHAVLAAPRGAVLRLPDVYGHPRDLDYARRVELAHAMMGGRVPFCPDALLHRIDYRDAAGALRHVVEHDLAGVYNAVPDTETPLANAVVFGAIAAAHGWPELSYGCQIEAPVAPISSQRLRSTGFVFGHSTVLRP